MKFNKLIYLLLFIAILGTTSVASAATEATWNDISFTVPDGYNTGTPSPDKIAMVNGGNRILLETFDEEGLNELQKESELKSNTTFNMNDLDITELQFETETGTKYLFLFTKNDQNYQISYFEPAPADEEEEESEDTQEETNETEDNATDNANDTAEETNETAEEDSEENSESTFDINDTANPVNVLINSLKF
jgi:hypothetical protein